MPCGPGIKETGVAFKIKVKFDSEYNLLSVLEAVKNRFYYIHTYVYVY